MVGKGIRNRFRWSWRRTEISRRPDLCKIFKWNGDFSVTGLGRNRSQHPKSHNFWDLSNSIFSLITDCKYYQQISRFSFAQLSDSNIAGQYCLLIIWNSRDKKHLKPEQILQTVSIIVILISALLIVFLNQERCTNILMTSMSVVYLLWCVDVMQNQTECVLINQMFHIKLHQQPSVSIASEISAIDNGLDLKVVLFNLVNRFLGNNNFL